MTRARVSLDAFTEAARKALAALHSLSPDTWVVGGALRDALMGRPAGDLDVAVPSDALALGRDVAARLGAAFVPLDRERGVARVIGSVQIDIADFRGPDLAADLRGRDFTVNALAAPVGDLLAAQGALVDDATGGLADLRARRVRLCGPRAFVDDPVRVLRAARLAIEPGWSLDPSAESAARDVVPRLAETSAERVRDELIAMLEAPAASQGLRLLDRIGALAVILPESLPMRRTPQPRPHRFDVWEHSLRAAEAMDEIQARLDRLEPWTAELREHLAEEVGDGATRAVVLKLGALLHDVAKPERRTEIDGRVRFIGHDSVGAERTRAIAARLRLSGRATAILAKLVDEHLRPMHLAQAGIITRRARYRFFRDLGTEARDLLLLSLADAAAVRGQSPFAVWDADGGGVVRSLMAGMAEAREVMAAPPLLTGHDVMAILGIGAGPAVGRWLTGLREAQALGRIRSREDAVAHLRRAARDAGAGGGNTARGGC